MTGYRTFVWYNCTYVYDRAAARIGHARMRLATVLLALALAAARPHGSASDRRALEALEARDQRALELAIAQNRTRLQTRLQMIGKCSTIAAGGPQPIPPSPLPFSACAH